MPAVAVKEEVMKTRTAMMVVIAVMAVQFAAAGEPAKKFTTEEKKIAFATENLLSGLHSQVSGVIESAMRVTAQMKMRYPQADVLKLVEAVNDIRQDHPSGSMRYKAYLALSICENPDWFKQEPRLATANEEDFYRAASVRLQEKLLSVNTY